MRGQSGKKTDDFRFNVLLNYWLALMPVCGVGPGDRRLEKLIWILRHTTLSIFYSFSHFETIAAVLALKCFIVKYWQLVFEQFSCPIWKTRLRVSNLVTWPWNMQSCSWFIDWYWSAERVRCIQNYGVSVRSSRYRWVEWHSFFEANVIILSEPFYDRA